ncbi:MAG: NTP transferase domain-containing protein [Rhodospirillales bacterium]|nr:NTP transferase domain-containing protein [Rhodospirillales bacterium]
MQCLILAGGLGTRINSLGGGLPKSLIPVAGRPFLDYQLRWLAAGGVDRVVLALGYGAEQIKAYAGDGQDWNLHIDYADDGKQPLGTGGAIRRAIDCGFVADSFFVLYGDSYLDVDLRAIWDKHQTTGLPVMTVFRNRGDWDASNVLMQDGVIKLFEKNRPDRDQLGMEYIDYGISLLSTSVIIKHVASGQPADLADVFHVLSVNGELAAFEASRRFYEIGSPAGHAELQAHLANPGRTDD